MITFLCHCGSQKNFISCCSPLLAGIAQADTAEQLMRSRYSAYVLKDEAYLMRTWHKSTRPKNLDLNDPIQWQGLQIRMKQAGGPDDDKGIVEFAAIYKSDGLSQRLLERSTFIKEKGLWFYVDGDTPQEPKQPVKTKLTKR
jgi:SEC-C motif-containing protein